MKVTKRNGNVVDFDKTKIKVAVLKAFISVDKKVTDESVTISNNIADYIESLNKNMTIEEIQDSVVYQLMNSERKDVAVAYIEYRHTRSIVREMNTTDETILELIDGKNDYWNRENSNKNASEVTVQRDYIAGVTSTDIVKRFLLDDDIIKSDNEGIIHFHDKDYFLQRLTNCCLVNLEDMLQNGTVINGVMIDKPHRLITAATIATQIITAVTSSQYGGASITLTHLAPFVRDSYNRYLNKYTKWGFDEIDAKKFAQIDLKKEISDAVQTFNYQCNSMSTTNGQAPFLTVFMYLNESNEYKNETALLIEEFFKQRILGMKNEVGVYITPAFPKLIYVLEDDNITKDSDYWYLTELAAKCTAMRMVPDYVSEKVMKSLKIDKNGDGHCYPLMGCRSALTPYVDEDNIPKYYGRFNQGVVTINLPDIAFSSNGNYDEFWKIFDERIEICHKALQVRHERLSSTIADSAPIMWRYGALARLDHNENIHKLLHNGYSTLSLGYAGLYECVKYMTGHSHTDGDIGEAFGLQVMQALNDKCNQWKLEENIDYSLYGTPIESTTYKFAKCLKKRFGSDIFVKLDGSDRDYITNSYHVPVFEEIDPFEKLSIESKFQRLSPGGAISYVECCDLTNNTEVVLEIIKFIYDNIMYAELNTKSDYCHICGYDGEIKIIDKNGELIWECPNCGNTDQEKMNVARRTCGYIGNHFWNQGRTDEIAHRYVHVDDHEKV